MTDPLVLIFTPTREPFASAPRGQLRSWLGYMPLDAYGDGGRLDGIQTEALAKLRVWPIGGPGVVWFREKPEPAGEAVKESTGSQP
jgi:hypothetical protein